MRLPLLLTANNTSNFYCGLPYLEPSPSKLLWSLMDPPPRLVIAEDMLTSRDLPSPRL